MTTLPAISPSNNFHLAMKIPIGEKNAKHVYQVFCVGVCRGISIKTKTEDGKIDLYARYIWQFYIKLRF